MRQKLFFALLIGFVVSVISSGYTTDTNFDLSKYKISAETSFCYNVPTEDQITYKPINITYNVFLSKSYVAFKEALAFKESQGEYFVVNDFGYLGKYQFSSNTLAMLGLRDASLFLNNSFLQEKAFKVYTSRNKWILRREIKRYVGTSIDGIKITESGILAAAHLAGAGSVKKFLRSGGNYYFNDAFGTSMRYYLKKFSGYDTSLIKPKKTAKI